MTAPVLPNPCAVDVTVMVTDDVTGNSDPEVTTLFLRYPHALAAGGGVVVTYVDGDDQVRNIDLVSLTADGLGESESGTRWAFRPVDPMDAVELSPYAGVPQPAAVVAADVQAAGGVLAGEINAMTTGDNVVVTLLLETGLGTYVRFSGGWQLLSPDSSSLDDLEMYRVAAGAVPLFDAADAAGEAIAVDAFPIVHDDGVVVVPDEAPPPMLRKKAPLPVAAGAVIPVVRTVDDLPVVIEYAVSHPDARWYVVKRARALQASGMVPPEWLVYDQR